MSLYDFFTPVSQICDEDPEYFRSQYSALRNSAKDASSAEKEGSDRIGVETIVGFLEEASMRQYKHPPRYEVLKQTGAEHNPIFTIACTAVGYQGGVGPNKRVAKITRREVLKKIVEDDDHKNFLIPGETKEERMIFM